MNQLGTAADPVTPDFHVTVNVDGDRLVILTRRESTGSGGERSYPLAAAAWVHEAITGHFWADVVPQQLALNTTLDGERLELRRSWGMGGPDERGFLLTNFNRLTPSGVPQELAMTDELLIRGGLLALLQQA
ncbi:MAG: hypothetical protein JWM80_3336 [Cyanobacteria bacterium RYN_339]|nr:hypothetical protein [Cyanobacteria bacterium RYN_339]